MTRDMEGAALPERPQTQHDVATLGFKVVDTSDADYYAALVEEYRPLIDCDRRRREAAWRYPPLASGWRDPLGTRADGMSS